MRDTGGSKGFLSDEGAGPAIESTIAGFMENVGGEGGSLERGVLDREREASVLERAIECRDHRWDSRRRGLRLQCAD